MSANPNLPETVEKLVPGAEIPVKMEAKVEQSESPEAQRLAELQADMAETEAQMAACRVEMDELKQVMSGEAGSVSTETTLQYEAIKSAMVQLQKDYMDTMMEIEGAEDALEASKGVEAPKPDVAEVAREDVVAFTHVQPETMPAAVPLEAIPAPQAVVEAFTHVPLASEETKAETGEVANLEELRTLTPEEETKIEDLSESFRLVASEAGRLAAKKSYGSIEDISTNLLQYLMKHPTLETDLEGATNEVRAFFDELNKVIPDMRAVARGFDTANPMDKSILDRTLNVEARLNELQGKAAALKVTFARMTNFVGRLADHQDKYMNKATESSEVARNLARDYTQKIEEINALTEQVQTKWAASTLQAKALMESLRSAPTPSAEVVPLGESALEAFTHIRPEEAAGEAPKALEAVMVPDEEIGQAVTSAVSEILVSTSEPVERLPSFEGLEFTATVEQINARAEQILEARERVWDEETDALSPKERGELLTRQREIDKSIGGDDERRELELLSVQIELVNGLITERQKRSLDDEDPRLESLRTLRSALRKRRTASSSLKELRVLPNKN